MRSLVRVNCSTEGFPSGSFVRIDFDHKRGKSRRNRSHRSLSAMLRNQENLTVKDDGIKALEDKLAQLKASIRKDKLWFNVLGKHVRLYRGRK